MVKILMNVNSPSDKRQAIEDAAEKLFVRYGYQATSTRLIAKEANVNVAMISYYFKSKEQLLARVFDKAFHAVNQITIELSDDQLSEVIRLDRLIDFYTDKTIESGISIYIILQEQVAKSSEKSVQSLNELNASQYRLFYEIIRSGIRKNNFREDVNIYMLFITLLGTMRFLVIEHSYMWLEENADEKRDFFRNAMGEANKHLKKLIAQSLIII